MSKTWVVVAENSRARIFLMKNTGVSLKELADMQRSEARSYERELTSDRPGRTFDSRGGGRHAKEPELTMKKHETINFAKYIADYINSESEKGKFEKLILISAPEFLGLLRKNLNEAVKHRITRQIDKNIVKQDEAFIRKQLAALTEQ
jgi:protein required for attachment to host cells